MPRGPSPTPTPILEARGSWRAKIRKGEAKPPVEAPTCPVWLNREAKAQWRRTIKQLERLGLAALVDRTELANFCEAWSRLVALEKAIDKVGVATREGVRLLYAANGVAKRVSQIAQQFGFTPASRTRVRVDAESQEKEKVGKGRFFRTA